MPFAAGYQRRPGVSFGRVLISLVRLFCLAELFFDLRFGLMRKGQFGYFSNAGGGITFVPDKLASYRTCSTDPGLGNQNMMVLEINNTEHFTTPTNKLYMDLFQPWGQDCEPMLQTRCSTGFTAVVNNRSWGADQTLTYLLQCNRCPSNSNTAGAGLLHKTDFIMLFNDVI